MKPSRSSRILVRASRSRYLPVALAFALSLAVTVPAFARPLVVIDPGHGGPYNHARYGSFLEKDANLLIALELGRQLYASGYDVRFTRTTDTAVSYVDLPTWHWTDHWTYAPDGVYWYSDAVPRDDLQARCDIANSLGADVFISVHCNGAASSSARGTENWASSHDILGQQLGQYVQAAVLEQTRQRDRGAGVTDFYVVRWTNMPALLVEAGFMSNSAEGAAIANATWRRAYAAGIVNGVNRWWSTAPTRPVHPRYTARTRPEAAVMASKAQWAAGADTLMLAMTSDTASALAAPLGTAKLGAPLLFADVLGITPPVAAEIARLHPSRIIALGAEVPDAVLAQAASAAGIDPSAVTRLAGAEAASTAPLLSGLTVSAETSTTIVLASATSPTEALAAASVASTCNGALLLARADGTLPPEAAAYLADHRPEIGAAIAVGTVPDGALAGLPNRVRIGSTDAMQTVAMNATVARPIGYLWLYCYNPLVPMDGIIAATAAARGAGGVAVPIAGTTGLSPYTREWLENNGDRVYAITMVGDYATLPPAVDHYVLKAID